MFNRLPALARFLLALIAIDLIVFAAFRGAFWAAFHEALANASRAALLKAHYLGLKFDLRLALLLCLPPALLGWIPLFDPARRRAARIAWLAYLSVAQCVVSVAYFVDFGHYAWVRVRLNASLVDHLTPVGVAARVAWETYPILLCVLALALLTGAYAWVAGRAARLTLVPAANPMGGAGEEKTPHPVSCFIDEAKGFIMVRFQSAEPMAQRERVMFAQIFHIANFKVSRLRRAQHHWQRRNISVRENVLFDE